jgi:dihydroflavonol-4-reductase
MHAFVTGATGCLGTHLVQELVAAGWEVTALRRTNSDVSQIEKLPGVRLALGDVTDPASLETAMPTGVDAVFHAAGSVAHLPPHLEHTRFAVNQAGTRHVVAASLRKRARRFIYSSTVLTYAFEGVARVTEACGPNTRNQDAYIRSKTQAEQEVEQGIQAGLDAVILHPSAIFGAYDKAIWSKMFLELQRGLLLPCAPPGGASIAHMRKVAQAHVAAFQGGGRGEHYILGGPDVTWLEVLQVASRLLGKPAPRWRLPGPLFRLYGLSEYRISTWLGREPTFTPHSAEILVLTVLSDSSKAVRDLGYAPSSLEEALTDCHQWMVAAGMLPQPKPAGPRQLRLGHATPP